jgi:hypothetical protein
MASALTITLAADATVKSITLSVFVDNWLKERRSHFECLLLVFFQR